MCAQSRPICTALGTSRLLLIVKSSFAEKKGSRQLGVAARLLTRGKSAFLNTRVGRACALRGFQDSMVVCLVRCLRTQG